MNRSTEDREYEYSGAKQGSVSPQKQVHTELMCKIAQAARAKNVPHMERLIRIAMEFEDLYPELLTAPSTPANE